MFNELKLGRSKLKRILEGMVALKHTLSSIKFQNQKREENEH
jgi:hypothetical protein